VEKREGKCVLVLGGEIKSKSLFRQRLDETEHVLAADSGARHLLDVGVMPEQVFGDLDSLGQEEIKKLEDGGCRFISCLPEKNDTDSGIVLQEAIDRGYKDIRIWGALGSRPDHSYANLILLQLVYLDGLRSAFTAQEGELPEIVIEDAGLRVFLPRRGQWLEGKKGEYLSLFALTPEVTGFTQKGLKYQPAGDRFFSGYPLGVSNEFLGDKVWVDWEEGILLCMQVDEAAYAAASGI
jgi:thiamine pyrophosphokinase